MSLVGTRPILQDELRQYELHHRARIAIKPGITGMWQVSGRSDITDFEEVVRLDTEYISKTSNFEAGVANGSIRYIPDEVYTAFVEQVKSDVLKFLLEDNCSLVVRPSGTEPKLKIYISVSAENKEMAEEVEDEIAKTAEKWIC